MCRREGFVHTHAVCIAELLVPVVCLKPTDHEQSLPQNSAGFGRVISAQITLALFQFKCKCILQNTMRNTLGKGKGFSGGGKWQ